MKVTNSRPVSSSAPARKARAKEAVSTQGAAGTRKLTDSGVVMGIPEDELTPKVRDAIMMLMEEVDTLRREVESNRARMLELEELADLDALLPILNRRAFMRELTRIQSFASRYQVQAGLIYFDLDNFKEIKDTYGHAAGDAVLKHVATTLEKNIRSSDAVGRLGGDEFGVILAQASAQQAMQKSKRLNSMIVRSPLTWEGHEIPIHVSQGVYSFEKGTDPATVLAEADRAMYEQKKERKANS
jgi:diguanylate cyclase (GGDEF)-like protein